MANISYKHKFIFIHSRRTGGTSLTLALLKFCDNKDIYSQINNDHVKWLESAAIKKYIRPNKSKKLYIKMLTVFLNYLVTVQI